MSTPFGAMISQFFENVQIHPQVANGVPERRFSSIDDEVDSSFEQVPDM